MRTTTMMFVVFCLIGWAEASPTGFMLGGTPEFLFSQGRVNCWAEARYDAAPQAGIFFMQGVAPEIVLHRSLKIIVYFSSDSGNWKNARVGDNVDGLKVELKPGQGRGSVLSAELPVWNLSRGLNGVFPIIGHKESYRSVVVLPIIGGIGRRPIYNEDLGMLLFNLIEPPVDLSSFPTPGNLTSLEVGLIVLNGGIPVIGSQYKFWLSQWLSQNEEFTLEKITRPIPTIESGLRWQRDDYPGISVGNPGYRICEQVSWAKISRFRNEPWIYLEVREDFSGYYSLVREGSPPSWQPVSFKKGSWKLELPSGSWHLRVRNIEKLEELVGPVVSR